jgi:hypothetical protein
MVSLWPSEAAVARIVDATRLTPADIGALRSDLSNCRWEILAKQIDTAAYRKSHKKAAARIGKQAAAQRALLKNSGNGLFDRQLSFALDPGEFDQAIALLSKIESEAERIAGDGITAQNTRGGRKDYLVALLEPIYGRHFNRPPGRSHDYDGPFPRFIEAVSAEMGRSLLTSKHTVHKSLARSRVGKKPPRRI